MGHDRFVVGDDSTNLGTSTPRLCSFRSRSLYCLDIMINGLNIRADDVDRGTKEKAIAIMGTLNLNVHQRKQSLAKNSDSFLRPKTGSCVQRGMYHSL